MLRDALNRGSFCVVLGAVDTRQQRGFELATEPGFLFESPPQFLGLLVDFFDFFLLLLVRLSLFILLVLVLTPDLDAFGRRVRQRRLPAPPSHQRHDRLQQPRRLRRRVRLLLPHRGHLAELFQQREHGVQRPVASLALPQRPQHGGQRASHGPPLRPPRRFIRHLVQDEPDASPHRVASLVPFRLIRAVRPCPSPTGGDGEQRRASVPVVHAPETREERGGGGYDVTGGDEGGEGGRGARVAALRGRHEEERRVPRPKPRAFVVRANLGFGHRRVVHGVG